MNEASSFIFSAENEEKVLQVLQKYPKSRSAILPILDIAQRQNGGWLSDSALSAVSAKLDLPKIFVLEVASFYTMFHLKPVGKYVVEVCKTLPCKLRGSQKILAQFEKRLGIELHETTKDKLFTLLPCECLGACVNAPVVKINDDYYENLSEEKVKEIIDNLEKIKTI